MCFEVLTLLDSKQTGIKVSTHADWSIDTCGQWVTQKEKSRHMVLKCRHMWTKDKSNDWELTYGNEVSTHGDNAYKGLKCQHMEPVV